MVSISTKSKATGKILNKLFQSAFSTAKIIRSKTNIGSNSITIPSAVLKISKNFFRYKSSEYPFNWIWRNE